MKRKIISSTFIAIAFSTLFYQQSIGINFLIFSILVATSVLITFKERSTSIYLTILSTLLCGVSALFYGSQLAVIIGSISILSLSYFCLEKKSSFIIAIGQGVIKNFFGPLISLSNIDTRNSQVSNNSLKINRTIKKIIYLVIPLLIAIIFIILYAGSNNSFNNFINKFTLNISWGFILFTILGSYFSFGFFFSEPEASLKSFDATQPETLQRKRKKTLLTNNLYFKFRIEVLTGIVLFTLLNLIISSVIIIDTFDLFFSNQQLSNSIYSDNVHSGITTLIISIISAIGLILYYFRGNINFYTKNKTIKNFALVWMILNAILVINTLTRTIIYIDHLGLTYKRIGVIVYLILTLIGIGFTWFKIRNKKTAWYLIKKTVWVFFLCFNFYPLFNWDKIITEFNVSKNTTPDIYYLTNLSHKNLVSLLDLPTFKIKDRFGNQTYHPTVMAEIIDFIQNRKNKTFSYNILNSDICSKIDKHQKTGDLNSVILKFRQSSDLDIISNIDELKHLTIISPKNRNLIQPLKKLKHLESLTLQKSYSESWLNEDWFQKQLPNVNVKVIITSTEY